MTLREKLKQASKVCSVDRCGAEHFGKGLCKIHYQRQYDFQNYRTLMAGVAHSQNEAKANNRTFYVSHDRCHKCFTIGRWAHDNSCMQCNPAKVTLHDN